MISIFDGIENEDDKKNVLNAKNELLKTLESFQPERSKREDGINTLRCGNCENEYDIFQDPNHVCRCGTLNSMET